MDTLDIMYWARKHIMDEIEELKPEDLNRVGVTTKWSIRDVISHLTSYQWLLVDALNYVLKKEESTPYLNLMNKDPEKFNDIEVEKRKNLTFKEAMDEFEKAYNKSIELAKEAGEELLRKVGTIPWYGDQYSLEDFIVYANYGHSESHTEGIKIFKRKDLKS